MINFHSTTYLCCDCVVLHLETIVQLERLERHIYLIWQTVHLNVGQNCRFFPPSFNMSFVKVLMCTDGLKLRMLRA